MNDVFDVFPEAIVEGVWQIGPVKRSTVTGLTISEPVTVPVIVDSADETVRATAGGSPGVGQVDILLYLRPEDCPTLDTAELVNGYAVHNLETDKDYLPLIASLGKNQNTGAVEHVELELELVDFTDNV